MRLTELVPKATNGTPATRGRYSEGWAWVRVKGSFLPEVIEARPGERLRLVFRREETAACSERILIPSLGRSVMLPPFEDVAIELGPLSPGEHEFRCELGVLRGRIVVGGRAADGSVVTTDGKSASTADDAADVRLLRSVGLIRGNANARRPQ